MKTLVLISTLALSALMVSAALPKPANIFVPDRPEKISRPELDLLANSAVLQRASVKYLFAQGDANKSGSLSLAELTNVYALIAPLSGWIGYHEEFIQNEFNQGNFIVKNQVTNIDELAFLCNRLFKFLNNNQLIFTELLTPEEWDQTLQIAIKLDQQIPIDIQYYDFPELYQEFNTDGNSGVDLAEYKAGLQSLSDRLGVNLTPDDYTIRDYFELLLPNSQGLVSQTKLRNALVPFLQNFLSHARLFLPIVEYPHEEEEIPEEEIPEEEVPEEEYVEEYFEEVVSMEEEVEEEPEEN